MAFAKAGKRAHETDWTRAGIDMRKRSRIARKFLDIGHPNFVKMSDARIVPTHADALERRKDRREGNTALVRHVNVMRLLGIEGKAVIRKEDVVMVTCDHLFGIAVFVPHNGIEARPVFQEPEPHIVAMIGILDVVAGSNALAQFREGLAEKRRIRLDDGNLDLRPVRQEFPDDGHATRRVSEAPIQRGHQDFYLASSHALAQSPWSQSLSLPISTRY